MGLYWMKKRGSVIGVNSALLIISFIIVYGALTPMIGKLLLVDVSSIFERSETLTGRKDIWGTLVPLAMERPFFGYGFGGFWTTALREVTSSHAHNGYLDVVLNLGFVGLVIFAMFLLSCCRNAQRIMNQDFDRGSLYFCCLLMAVVHNITESSIDSFSGYVGAVILFFTVSSSGVISDDFELSQG
jgi:O-antigen ligase